MKRLITQWRLTRYHQRLQSRPLTPTHLPSILTHLLYHWRYIRVADVSTVIEDRRYRRLTTHSTNITELVTKLKEHDRLVRLDKEAVLEVNLKNQPTPAERTLDTYLVDGDGMPVDTLAQLEELQLMILLHGASVRAGEADFIKRVSVPLYRDLTELTYTLFET